MPKEKTITYTSRDCEHINLKKIAPLWYLCKDCGTIFMIPISMKYTKAMAVEHLGNVLIGIKDNQKIIRKAEKQVKKKEAAEEKKAVEDYKNSIKNGGNKGEA